MQPYEFKEHTADIIARTYGATLEEAFGNAARAMFHVLTGGAEIGETRQFAFDVESIDLEGLLVGFLSQLIVLHETENVVLSRFEVTLSDERHLHAICHGESFDSARHGGGGTVKGVSYHMMEIEKGDRGRPSHVQVLFDV
jgi:SHS2 domain-containing protein